MPGTSITNTTRNNETFDGYLTMPESTEKLPGILLITAILGVDEEMRKLSDEWASDGFIVSTPDIFWRQTPGPTSDMEVAFDRMNRFDVEQGMRDIEDLVDSLRRHPRCNGKIAVLGFCFGGRYAHLASARLNVQAAGAFHGSAIEQNLDEAAAVRVPVSYHFGDQDPVIPMESVAQIKEAFAGHPGAEIVVHHNATHGFSMPRQEAYNPAVAAAARSAVLSCFRRM